MVLSFTYCKRVKPCATNRGFISSPLITMKEVIIMSIIIFATVMSFFIHTDNDEDRQ